MEKCDYCEMNNWTGEYLPLIKNIGEKRQNLEVYIVDTPDYECRALQIESIYLDIMVEIKFCPMCGRKL